MKVLILTVSAGQGHNQVASALGEILSNNGFESKVIDTLEYIDPIISKTVDKGYLLSTKHLPKLYGKVYGRLDKNYAEQKEGLFFSISKYLMAKAFISCIEKEQPDAIICTHVFPALFLTQLKTSFDHNIFTAGIVTDFTLHPFWEFTDIDAYITPHELLTSQIVKKGIPEDKIYPIGIPIRTQFAVKHHPTSARHILNIPDTRTLLIMGGSMGYGKMEKTILALDELDTDFQMIIVCGNNKRLYKKLSKTNFNKKVHLFGFADNVDIMMDASDCIITKPGGLTTSEALAKGLPMIFTKPIPGHEERNVEFLVNNGVGMKVSKTFPVEEAVSQFFHDSKKPSLIRQSVQLLGKPNATYDLVSLIRKNIK